jgi:hypothetical protein
MLLATFNVANSAQNCPKLPKFAKICPKMKLWNSTKNQGFSVFSKIKICTYRGGTRACFHCLDFQSKNFLYAIFIVKNGLCMWISAYPFVQNDVYFKVPYVSWIWDFVDMYLTHLGTRIWSPAIHTYSIKWFFWPPNIFFQLWTLWSCKQYGMNV